VDKVKLMTKKLEEKGYKVTGDVIEPVKKTE
jgi:hypothetical protein